MPSVKGTPLPRGALLAAYVGTGAYTDCYSVLLPRKTTLAEFMSAFYTTPLFKLERWLLGRILNLPSTDQEAEALAEGKVIKFAVWNVEARELNQTILAAGRTRSWLMVAPQTPESDPHATLFFGSAVVPRRRGGFGLQFRALLTFHNLYSRSLLSMAARRLMSGRSA